MPKKIEDVAHERLIEKGTRKDKGEGCIICGLWQWWPTYLKKKVLNDNGTMKPDGPLTGDE